MNEKELGKEIELDRYINSNGEIVVITQYIGRKGNGWSQSYDVMIEKTYEKNGEVTYAEVLFTYNKADK